jgi:hypothetical protein
MVGVVPESVIKTPLVFVLAGNTQKRLPVVALYDTALLKELLETDVESSTV